MSRACAKRNSPCGGPFGWPRARARETSGHDQRPRSDGTIRVVTRSHLQLLLLRGHLAERRREGPQGDGGQLHQDVDDGEAVAANVARELQVVQGDVQHGLGKVRVELGERVAKLEDVLSDAPGRAAGACVAAGRGQEGAG